MKLYYNKNKYIEINNENNKEYIVLTNVEDFKLEAVKLCIFYLNLKQDIIITNAYNIFGNELYDMYGIYINKKHMMKILKYMIRSYLHYLNFIKNLKNKQERHYVYNKK